LSASGFRGTQAGDCEVKMIVFAYIGMVVVAAIAIFGLLLLKEFCWLGYRAFVQTRRITAVYRALGHQRPAIRPRLRLFFGELFSSYTELRIQGVTLPWDVRKPTGEWWGG
jgi:hypothetical protein